VDGGLTGRQEEEEEEEEEEGLFKADAVRWEGGDYKRGSVGLVMESGRGMGRWMGRGRER